MIKIDWYEYFRWHHPLGFYTYAEPDWGSQQAKGLDDKSLAFWLPNKYSIRWSWWCFKKYTMNPKQNPLTWFRPND